MRCDEDWRTLLEAIAVLLEDARDPKAGLIREALAGTDEDMDWYLKSNELWGGAGSIADEGAGDSAERRTALEHLLVELGRRQLALGNGNQRTEMWVSAFEQWSSRE